MATIPMHYPQNFGGKYQVLDFGWHFEVFFSIPILTLASSILDLLIVLECQVYYLFFFLN